MAVEFALDLNVGRKEGIVTGRYHGESGNGMGTGSRVWDRIGAV